MRKPMSILLFLVILVSPVICYGETTREYLMIIKDKVPLRVSPTSSSKIAHMIFLSHQLIKVGQSADGKWFKVIHGEQKSYQIPHEKEFWIDSSDVYVMNEASSITINVGLRINSEDLKYSYYPDPYCFVPYSICSEIPRPDYKSPSEFSSYFGSDVQVDNKELGENFIAPKLEINSKRKIESLEVQLSLAKVIMKSPSCYPEIYLGTEIEHIASEQYLIEGTYFKHYYPVALDSIYHVKHNGGVQEVYFLFVINVKFVDGTTMQYIRRINMHWSMCA